MPFIELRDKENPEKIVLVNTDHIITVEARQGTYGPIFRMALSDGKEISNSYSSFEEAEKIVAELVRVLRQDIPMVTL
ncbi:MAG: hypothetical protein ACRYG7_13170 [Janthinobacterium lividum]